MKKLSSLCSSMFLVAFLVAMNFSASAQNPIPKVTVIQPSDAGIEWIIGQNNLISWTDNFVKPVDIYLVDYSTASPTVNLIKSNVTGSTYDWPTNTQGVVAARTQYKIRVQSSVNSIYQDESDATFSLLDIIPGTMKVIQPSVLDIVWQAGTPNLISWEDSPNENVMIRLIKGSVLHSVINSSASGSTWVWNIPSDLPEGNDYRIKILGVNSGASAISDHYFSVKKTLGGSIELIQPNDAGIEWRPGTRHLISWQDELTEPVKIELINYGTATPTIEVLKPSVSGSTWEWLIPVNQTLSTHYKIKISSTIDPDNYSNESDYEFAIGYIQAGHINEVIQPKGGEEWLVGTSHLISWDDELEESVEIWLLNYTATGGTGSPTTETRIKDDAVGSTWSWPAVGPVGTHFKIEIRSNTNTNVTPVKSAGFFSIVNTLGGGFNEIFQPVAGDNWLRNTTYLISWEDNIAEGVDVWISNPIPSGTTTATYTVAKQTNVIGSTYLWSTGNVIEYGDYKIKLTSTLDNSIKFESGIFHIVQSLGGGITAINQPNEAGLKWVQGTTNLISWDDNLVENVKIELVYYGVAGTSSPTFTIIPGAESVPGTTWLWAMSPTQALGFYRIKIWSTLPDGPFKSAENQFKIIQLIDAAVYPNPCGAYTTVQFDESSNGNYVIEMFDRFGTSVMQKSVNTSETKQVNLSTSDLPNGIYLLNMTSGETRISKKIVVQH